MAPQDSGVRYNVTCVLIRLGHVDEALDLVEENVKLGWGNAEWLAHDPDMNPVRSHPRFIALLETMPKRRTPGA
jgi:adenylate cyclase